MKATDYRPVSKGRMLENTSPLMSCIPGVNTENHNWNLTNGIVIRHCIYIIILSMLLVAIGYAEPPLENSNRQAFDVEGSSMVMHGSLLLSGAPSSSTAEAGRIFQYKEDAVLPVTSLLIVFLPICRFPPYHHYRHTILTNLHNLQLLKRDICEIFRLYAVGEASP